MLDTIPGARCIAEEPVKGLRPEVERVIDLGRLPLRTIIGIWAIPTSSTS